MDLKYVIAHEDDGYGDVLSVTIEDGVFIVDVECESCDNGDRWRCTIDELEQHIANYKTLILQNFVEHRWPDCNYSVIAASGEPSDSGDSYDGLLLLRDNKRDLYRLAWLWDGGVVYNEITLNDFTREFINTLAASINKKGE